MALVRQLSTAGFQPISNTNVLYPDSQSVKDNYGRLIDFLSKISKLSYFYLLDVADFLMYH